MTNYDHDQWMDAKEEEIMCLRIVGSQAIDYLRALDDPHATELQLELLTLRRCVDKYRQAKAQADQLRETSAVTA